MFDIPLFLLNAALCLAALGCAAFVRPGRGEALVLAALLNANFYFCALGYTSYAPKHMLEALGVAITTKETWMVADALLGAAAVIAFRRWWAWALWATTLCQQIIHGGYMFGLFSDVFYTDRLQNVLHAQIALFFLIGGRGLADFLHRHIARFCGARRTPATARTPAPSPEKPS